MKLKPSIYNKEGEALIAELVGEVFGECDDKFKRDVVIEAITGLHNKFKTDKFNSLERDRFADDWPSSEFALRLFECGWEIDDELLLRIPCLFYRIDMEFINLEVEHLRSRKNQQLNQHLALKQLKNKQGDSIPLRPSMWNKADRETAIRKGLDEYLKVHPFAIQMWREEHKKKDPKEEIIWILNRYLISLYGSSFAITDCDVAPIMDSFQLAKVFETFRWKVCGHFVAELSEICDLIDEEGSKMLHEWFDKYQPQTLPEGATVTLNDSSSTGVITVHLPGFCGYIINDMIYLYEHVELYQEKQS